jgi:hypothetical protein
MDQQVRQLFGQAVMARACLVSGGLGRNDDIPQKLGVQIGKRPFTHGKSQDIGRTVDAAILGVEPLHMGVIDNEHAQLTILAIESCE